MFLKWGGLTALIRVLLVFFVCSLIFFFGCLFKNKKNTWFFSVRFLRLCFVGGMRMMANPLRLAILLN